MPSHPEVLEEVLDELHTAEEEIARLHDILDTKQARIDELESAVKP